MILLIDNYDSFVHNLARYFVRLGESVLVCRNDAISLTEVTAMRPNAIVISPGPCGPAQAGISIDLVKRFAGEIPILGVCLGHQAIVTALGGDVIKSGSPMHGRSSMIEHDHSYCFANVPSPFQAGRYHSLIARRENLPSDLKINAWTEDGTIMGVQHKVWPVIGLQFHPESILTEFGLQIISNFLQRVNRAEKSDCDSLPMPGFEGEIIEPSWIYSAPVLESTPFSESIWP
jgi:anthranilate synthase/aminodeoxychorismate synthase-like glutamine amidotransferase